MPRYKRTRGGASKKQKKFPRISSYLELNEKDVYQLFEDAGAMHFLTPTRNQSGKVLMLPDAKLIKKIRTQIDGDQPEEATDMLMSLTIPLPLKTCEDWERLKQDIPTAYGNRVEFISQDGKKVLVNGGELTLDTKFQPFDRVGKSKRGNVFVWKLKGEIDYANGPQASMEFVNKDVSKVGGEIERDYTSEITAFINECLEKEKTCMKSGGKNSSHILNVVCNFIAHIKRTNDQRLLTFTKESVCPDPLVSFFMIFGSHSSNSTTMFDSKFICDIKDRLCGAFDKPVDYLINFCMDHSDLEDKGLWFGNQAKVAEVRTRLTWNKLDNINVHNTAAHIIKIYNELDTKNTLGGLSNILPQLLLAKYGSNPGLHLRRDEARYLLCSFYKQTVGGIPQVQFLKVSEMNEMIRCIKQIYGKDYQIDNARRHIFVSIVKSFTPLDKLNSSSLTTLGKFLESAFLFMPCFTGKINVYGEGEEDSPNLESEMFGSIYGKYENSKITLSDTTIEEMKNYLESVGDVEFLHRLDKIEQHA